MKPSKVGRSRTDAESLIEMMATVGLDASDLTAFRDMNSTDFSMGNNWGGRFEPVLILRFLRVLAGSTHISEGEPRVQPVRREKLRQLAQRKIEGLCSLARGQLPLVQQDVQLLNEAAGSQSPQLVS